MHSGWAMAQTCLSTGLEINKNFEPKIVNIFLPFSFNICFGFSKEQSH